MAKCKSCIGAEIKKTINREFPHMENILEEIPDCKAENVLIICSPGRGVSDGTKTKRAPSAYNNFVSTCMKGGKGMKECAAEYRERQA